MEWHSVDLHFGNSVVAQLLAEWPPYHFVAAVAVALKQNTNIQDSLLLYSKKIRIFENLLVVDVAQEDATELAAVAKKH